VWTCPRPSMPSTRRPSICACRFSLGKVSPPQSAVKLHTLLDVRGSIPTSVLCDRRADPRCQPPRRSAPGTGSVLLARPRLRGLCSSLSVHQACAFFVTRAKKNLQFYCAPRARSIVPAACAATKAFASPASARRSAIPICCAASPTTMPRRTCG